MILTPSPSLYDLSSNHIARFLLDPGVILVSKPLLVEVIQLSGLHIAVAAVGFSTEVLALGAALVEEDPVHVAIGVAGVAHEDLFKDFLGSAESSEVPGTSVGVEVHEVWDDPVLDVWVGLDVGEEVLELAVEFLHAAMLGWMSWAGHWTMNDGG